MADKFQNKYRIPSARLQNWDYGWNAAYFVTICTKDRECFFGEIVNVPSVETQNHASSVETPPIVETQNFASLQEPTMQLSQIGKTAGDYWLEIPCHFPFVKLENHIVMPNHVHGIIIIDKPDDGCVDDAIPAETQNVSPVETQNFASLQSQPSKNKFGPQSQNLASIIRGYKSAVKKYATLNNINFAWQSRFHDHIIRDNQSFHNISEYIKNNPLNWSADQFFK